ncbi:metallophosphoesterase [Corynebacterium felinum]|uniref:Nuclease SbcCD subunit D n=1 Tax=Corynebacterium felinum TaxID=131318 RepID=A0ABU2BAI5_9CORY|nr:metallophosphoesterase [Corynebacterium felinum]MDF5821886.1 metallophosphoesterase [Corynebacterium felinum]MDR7355301.1 DNA repair exonuclease SbcCD nuclease subunit [Corynebacterium felinum]WJY94654.1 putative metallophosphoesterase YhaO [Corynebacterium felinum]
MVEDTFTQVRRTHVRFVHTSDLQIGMTRWFLSAEAQPRFEAARKDVIARIGHVAVDNECEFIVIAGDVFEHNSIHARVRDRAIEALAQLPVPVVLLPGNHDPLTADSVFFHTQAHENIHVIDSFEERELIDGVSIVGAPYKAKSAQTDLVAHALAPLEPTNTIRIAIGHGQVHSRGNADKLDLIDLALVESKISDGSIDYLALGDTHSAEPVGSTGRVWFSGAPEPTDFYEYPSGTGEHNAGKVLIVDVDKQPQSTAESAQTTVTVTEKEVGTWTFSAPTFEINNSDELADFFTYLDNHPNKDRCVIKYALTGRIDIDTMRQLEEGLANRELLFAALYPRERLMDLDIEPSDDDIATLNLHGFASDSFDELRAMNTPEATDALKLLFRLNAKTH